MAGVARDGGDRRAGPPGEAMPPCTWNQPAHPLALVPPVAHGAAVVRDREHVEMLGIARDDADRRRRPRLQGRERADAVPDHLAADPAERHAERAHLAVVLGPETRRSG